MYVLQPYGIEAICKCCTESSPSPGKQKSKRAESRVEGVRWQATRQPGIWEWAPRASGANHTISRFFSFLVYFLFNPQVVLHHPFEKATWPISHVIWRRPNVVRLARSTPRTRHIGDCQRGRILYEPHWMDGCVCVSQFIEVGEGACSGHTQGQGQRMEYR